MNAKQKIHQVRLQEWAVRFSEQKASGLTVRQWCEQNNCSIHKYNYWKHLLKEEVTDQILPDIAPLYAPAQASAYAPTGSLSPGIPNSNAQFRANGTNRANCANRAMVSFTANGISFEFDSPIPESFLCSLIKAVRHA